MNKIKYIVFDCMETLIDVTELPSTRDYAWWGFNGSGIESYWKNFEEYFNDFIKARDIISSKLPEHKEYEMLERFIEIARLKFFEDEGKIAEISSKIYKNYWKTYVEKCYIKCDVEEMIPELSKNYKLGVVSNFMIDKGIEELLERKKLINHFDFIITSINVGWRKPHEIIYRRIFDKFNEPENILFIGDDFKNDYTEPKKYNMKSLLLDRNNRYPEIKEKINNFYDLKSIIKNA